jgi:hypothetical protein
MPGLMVEFCGEVYPLEPGESFTIGRDADLTVDEDNAYLHRRMVQLDFDHGFWWITNVGSRLAVTVSGGTGTLQSLLGPGSRLPVVLPAQAILFTAGETTYEVNVTANLPTFEPVHASGSAEPGDATLGSVDLTSSQFLLILALAENTLRRVGTGANELPTNAAAAARLGWPITTFNRKLDNVCDKFSRSGVKGLRGGAESLAVNRRARLVEYAVAARIVLPDHLPMLDEAVEA